MFISWKEQQTSSLYLVTLLTADFLLSPNHSGSSAHPESSAMTPAFLILQPLWPQLTSSGTCIRHKDGDDRGIRQPGWEPNSASRFGFDQTCQFYVSKSIWKGGWPRVEVCKASIIFNAGGGHLFAASRMNFYAPCACIPPACTALTGFHSKQIAEFGQ